MNVPYIKKITIPNLSYSSITMLVVILNLIFLANAHATKDDLTQQITIKSKSQSADLKNKIASYLDNVNIQQGSISISADLVQVFSKENIKTGKKEDTYFAQGQPAVFEQQLEDGSFIKLQANEITYKPDLFTINVSGNASVKQSGSEVSGNEITYNILNEKLEAQSGENQSVTTILQPSALKKQNESFQESKNNRSQSNDIGDLGDY
jgi:lipopolysaccharide export system protein LptA